MSNLNNESTRSVNGIDSKRDVEVLIATKAEKVLVVSKEPWLGLESLEAGAALFKRAKVRSNRVEVLYDVPERMKHN